MGLKVFDSLAVLTARNGYMYETSPFSKIEKSKKPVSLLLVDRNMTTGDSLYERLWNFVRKGNNVMIVATYISSYAFSPEKIGATIHHLYTPSTDDIFNAFKNGESRNVVPSHKFLNVKDSAFGVNRYFINSYVDVLSDNWNSLAYADFPEHDPYQDDGEEEEELTVLGKKPVAAVRKMGKGKLYFVANSFLFTNYGALDPVISKYQSCLLSLIDDKPIIRLYDLYDYEEYVPEGNSPFRFFLENEPLRWALYTAFGTLLLFLAFMARRWQRVIPFIEQPRNRTVEFVQLMGNIYFKQRDRDDMFMKKYNYFCEEMRRRQLIDIGERSRESEIISVLSGTTGLPANEVDRIMRDIWSYSDGKIVPNDRKFRKLVDEMNLLLERSRGTKRFERN